MIPLNSEDELEDEEFVLRVKMGDLCHPDGDDIIKLDVKASDTIDIVKTKIQDKLGVPKAQQHLCPFGPTPWLRLRDGWYEDGHTLSYLKISEESIILCIKDGPLDAPLESPKKCPPS